MWSDQGSGNLPDLRLATSSLAANLSQHPSAQSFPTKSKVQSRATGANVDNILLPLHNSEFSVFRLLANATVDLTDVLFGKAKAFF